MGCIDAILSPPSRRTAAGGYDVWNDDSAWTIRGATNGIGGKSPAAGIPVDYHTALNCAAALACTRAIAETMATLPALVFETMPDETRQKARTNPMWRLLHDKPNPDMDSVTFYGMQTKRLVNRGNAYSLIEYNEREEPIALWPVHNSRVRPWRRPYQFASNGRRIGGDLYYRIFVTDDPKDDVDVEPRHMLNVVGFDSEDGVTACGVVPRAKEEISLDTAAQEFSGTVYGNGAMPLGLVKYPGWIQDDKTRDIFRGDINKIHRGRENWNNIGILWNNASWEKLGFSPEEVQSLAGRILTAKIICQYYGVPPGIVQIFDDYKFSTVEAMLKHFIMLCIRPYAVRWEKAVGTQLLGGMPENVFLEFALEGLLRGDPLAQAQANSLMRQWGVLSANEWRGQFNWNPVEDGDKQIVPMNYTTLKKIGTQATIIPGAKSGAAETQEMLAQFNTPPFDQKTLANAVANLRISQATRGSKRRKKSGGRLRSFALQVVADSVARMATKERNAVIRAAKQPETFLVWLDDYHSKFRSTLADSLAIGVQGYCSVAPNAAATISNRIAEQYVNASREALLKACECQPKEFESRIAAAVEAWPPIQITDQLLKGFSNAA